MSVRTFKGRVVVKGSVSAEALVSKGGFNTLASYQHSLMFGDKTGKCSDQNNADLYKKPMAGKALCISSIASFVGGFIGTLFGFLSVVLLAYSILKQTYETRRDNIRKSFFKMIDCHYKFVPRI